MTIVAEPAAPGDFLFAEEALQRTEELVQVAERRGEYTGQRLRKEAPRLVEAALRLAALECTQEEIAFALQLSPNSIQRLLVAHAAAVENYKEGIAQSWREVTHLTVQAIKRKLMDPRAILETTLKDLAVLAGIATEKTELVMGGVTQRIGVQRDVAPIEDFNNYIESLKPIREMGLTAAGISPNGGAPAAGALAPARSDVVSDVSATAARVTQRDATEAATTAPGAGGGVPTFDPGGGEALDAEARHGYKGADAV